MLIHKKTKACQNERMLLSGDDILLFLLGNGGNLNLRVLLVRCEFGHETPYAVLELAIFAGVDERVDAAVGEHQYHGKVVEPADEIDNLEEKKINPYVRKSIQFMALEHGKAQGR